MQIELLEKYGATMLDDSSNIADFDDIILLNDLNSLASDQQAGETKLIIKTQTNQVMQNLIRTCRNKFKPFYDKLIMPLIKLSNLGYNYQGELLVHELEELRSNKLVRRWYNIVQVCEAFASIEIFEDPEILSDGCQAFTFISSEEAGELRKSEHLSLEELAAREHERPIEYKPSSAQNSDQLWIQDQEELERLINTT